MATTLFILAFGLLASWMAIRIFSAVRATRHWLSVPGNILERDVGRMSTGRNAWYPIVKYQYQVEGKSYTNDNVYIIGRFGGRGQLKTRMFVDQLPDPIPVHYDPKDPARSYLLRNPRWVDFMIYTAAIVVMFVGLVRLLASLP